NDRAPPQRLPPLVFCHRKIAMIPPRVNVETVQAAIGEYADPVASREERGQIYQELIGFVPPRIEARLNVTGALDPKMLDLQEQLLSAVRQEDR
ncbi:MAG TPA: hypothetical protein PKO06_00255, partial [Candidatus Ozemobacteraceae bacterium]|nr:hypothetical protein [Candidatus Ozemobacteraceae bacterium]